MYNCQYRKYEGHSNYTCEISTRDQGQGLLCHSRALELQQINPASYDRWIFITEGDMYLVNGG